MTAALVLVTATLAVLALCLLAEARRIARLEDSEGVGTGAGEGATGQDTGTAWVTRSADCPEAPAQAHPLAAGRWKS